MNKLFFTLFLGLVLVGTVSATNWYVDNAVATSGNGQSWNTAWKAFSNIAWANVKAGDTIYVSGGSTSKTYPKVRITYAGISGGIVTITKGIDVGHNGEVIFLATTSTFPAVAFYLDGAKNIKVSGMTFKLELPSGEGSAFAFGNSATGCTVENSHVISNGNGHAIGLNTVSNITIRNNTIETLTNTYMSEQDGIIIGAQSGDILIENNIILLRGNHPATDSNSPHMDGIQFYNVNVPPNLGNVIIRNNFIRAEQLSTSRPMAGIYTYNVNGNWLVYNNIIKLGGGDGWVSALAIDAGTHFNLNLNAKIFNNVIITKSIQNYPVAVRGADSTQIKNNILYGTSTGNQYMMNLLNSTYNKSDISNNIFYKVGGSTFYDIRTYDAPDGSPDKTYSFAQWNALGYESNSAFVQPTFVNINGIARDDFKLVKDSRGIDEGIPIAGITDDILGMLRPQGFAWDIGAYEYVDGTTIFHPADYDTDGCVDLSEISSYVSLWLNEEIDLQQVSSAVRAWLGGCQT